MIFIQPSVLQMVWWGCSLAFLLSFCAYPQPWNTDLIKHLGGSMIFVKFESQIGHWIVTWFSKLINFSAWHCSCGKRKRREVWEVIILYSFTSFPEPKTQKSSSTPACFPSLTSNFQFYLLNIFWVGGLLIVYTITLNQALTKSWQIGMTF